ncbi:hypothetical protein L2E82_52629 [Cichorium intybus]|nr:hypothetical protein L2E82_52629 [Cichorium intybus]
MASLLSKLPGVQRFYTDCHVLKFLSAEKFPKLLPCEISSLKHLSLLQFEHGGLDKLHGVLYLLRNSPNLETLLMMDLKESRVDNDGIL